MNKKKYKTLKDVEDEDNLMSVSYVCSICNKTVEVKIKPGDAYYGRATRISDDNIVDGLKCCKSCANKLRKVINSI